MADRKADSHVSALDQTLDHYIEAHQTDWVDEYVVPQVRRAPWWAISLLVHAIVLLVLWRWPCTVRGEERTFDGTECRLVEAPPDEAIAPVVTPDEPIFDKQVQLDMPIEDAPFTDELVSDEPLGADIDLPQDVSFKDVERPVPSIDPPSRTPVIGVHDDRPAHTTGYYSGRTTRGRSLAIGKPWGTTRQGETSVELALLWLARAQSRAGHWDARRWGAAQSYDVGTTGLGLLAFLGAGYTHNSGRYKSTVARALSWLAANQKPNGQFPYKTFYEQGIATMAVSEAYGLTHDPRVGRLAQKAVNFIVRIQPDHGGFRYGGAVPKAEGDLSVTGWQIMAIKSAVCSKLDVPSQAIDRCRVYLKNSYRDYGKSCYTVGAGAGGPAMWAVGMACRQFIGGDYDADIRAAGNALLNHEKAAAGGQDSLVRDLYYTYYSVLAMYQMGPNTEYWFQWNRLYRDPLVKAQTRKRFDEQGQFVRGSWDPANHRWGSRGGRVYTTAMAVLTLEVYYRFIPLYRSTN